MLRTLMHREWREVRAVTLGTAIAAVIASVAIDAWFLHGKDGALTAVWVVPALLALYLAIVASDLVAGDVATQRIDAMALLPTGLSRLWIAKVAFALAAGAAFLAGLVALEWTIVAIGGVPGQANAFVAALPDAGPNLAFAFVLFAAVLFFSTFVRRGFAAVVAGLAVLGAVAWLERSCDWVAWGIDVRPMHVGVAASIVALVFLAGSALAFVRGPVHGPALRRALVGVAVPLAVFVPVGVGSAVALDRMLTLEAGSADARFEAIFPSPDGKYVAVRVQKKDLRASSYVWIVRTADGHVVARPEANLSVEGWSADGHVVAWEYSGASPHWNSVQSHMTRARSIDPATGEFVRLPSDVRAASASAEVAYPVAARSFRKRASDGLWVVRDAATGAETAVDAMPDGDLSPYPNTSPHGRYAAVESRRAKGSTWVLDLVERRVIYSSTDRIWFSWIPGRDDDRFALACRANGPAHLIDLANEPRAETVPAAALHFWNTENIAAAQGDGFLLSHWIGDVSCIDVVDTQCRTIRRVYPPDR